jgi:hypothetical protein
MGGMNIFKSFVSQPTPAASPHPSSARSLRVSPRWGIAWLLIALLGSGTAVHTSAQTEAPLRVAVEAADDRAGTCCQVAEGAPIRVFLTPIDGRSGDPPVEVRWRIFAASCDDGVFGAIPLQEGSTFVQAGDPERVLEVPTPDDWTLQSTNRCLGLAMDFPGLAAPAPRHDWLYSLLDNETRFPEGVTPWLPDFSSSGYGVPFVASTDGSAYLIRNLNDYSSGKLVRLRPDLGLDPQFHAELPPGFQAYDLEALPDGGVVVWDYRTLLKLDSKGVRDRTFRPGVLTNGVSTVKADASGRLYVSDSRRILRLRPDGSIDPDFVAPSFTGEISAIWPRGERVYVAGKFDTVAGISASNVAVFRLNAVTGLDSGFSPTLATNQTSGVSQVVETSDGRVITYGRPVLRVYSADGRLLSERTVDGSWRVGGFPFPGGASGHEAWGNLALLSGGMVVGSSESIHCNKGCWRSVSLEVFESGNGPGDTIQTIPSLNEPATGRLISSGNFLWAEERGENRLRFRRYRIPSPPQDSFGFLESKESVTPALSYAERGTVRRFGDSKRRLELSLMVQLLETDSTVGFEPFTTSVVMEPGDVAKPIPLPTGFRPSPNSLSRLRAELLPTEGVAVEGAGSIEFLVAGVVPSPSEPLLTVHRINDDPWFQRILVTLSGPEGSYAIQVSLDGMDWRSSSSWDGKSDSILLGSDHFAPVAELDLLTSPWGDDQVPGTFFYRVVRFPSP